jgi:hypothetical protein
MLGKVWRVLATTLAVAVSGCGTRVPSLQELSPESDAEQKLVQAVVKSIHCDISNAVLNFLLPDRTNTVRQGAWLENWGAQVTITLQVEEKTALAANALGMPGNALFTMGGSVGGSADATRINTVNYFYTVKQLIARGGCTTGVQPNTGAPSFLIQNDLGVGQWLYDQLAVAGQGEGGYPTSPSNAFKQNVLSHEVKFVISTSADATPSWKLVNVSVNSTGPFFSTSRDRTSDLLVTFGPLDPAQNNQALAPQAAQIHWAQQIGLANGRNSNVIIFSVFPPF